MRVRVSVIGQLVPHQATGVTEQIELRMHLMDRRECVGGTALIATLSMFA